MPDTTKTHKPAIRPDWLTADQVGQRYGCSRNRVYTMVRQGLIPEPHRFSARMSRWARAELDAADAARMQERAA